MTGLVVPEKEANALMFIPRGNAAAQTESGARLRITVPFAIHKTSTNIFYANNWGCKICKNGSYRVSLHGAKTYFDDNLFKNLTITLKSGETFALKNVVPIVQGKVEALLQREANKPLTQPQVTSLLQRVQNIFDEHIPGLDTFYLADFWLDKTFALDYLANHAGHTYRKHFSLLADDKKQYVISEKTIMK
jgi:hypothetical protein